MKRVALLTRLSLVSTLLGVLSTCGGDGSAPTDPGGNGEPPDPVLTSIVVSPGSSSLSAIERTVQLSAVPRDQDGGNMSGVTFSWSSSDGAVASVTNSGLVKALDNGQAIIRATSGSVTGTATVTVEQVVASVTVSPTDVTLTQLGGSQQFIAEAGDANGHPIPGITYSWVSSDGTVATVSGTGLATAVAEGQATITAATGDHEGNASLAVVLENMQPSVTIASPAEGSVYSSGETVTFEGAAEDPEDGSLPEAVLVWTSSRDGQIGTGSSFGRDDLSAGSHTVSLTATDSDGATAVGTVSIGIDAPPNQPPSATITAPVDGSTVITGEPISFQGGATDPEDGSLTGGQLVWTSDLDGQIGTGVVFTRSDLSIGDHSITLTATDSEGATGTASVDLTVQPVPVGAIELTVSSVGQDIPPNYVAVLDGSTSETVGSNGSTTFSDLVLGTYSLELTDLPHNCQVAGDNPMSVTVTASTTAAVTMSVDCRALVGTIRVVAETNVDLDPDGYLVSLDGGSVQSIPANGSVTFLDVPVGNHQVALSGLASNCTLTGSSVRNVDVADGQTSEEVFAVTCESAGPYSLIVVGSGEIFTIRPDGSDLTTLTPPLDGIGGSAPKWSPDGSKIAFQTSPNDPPWGLNVMDADGSNRVLIFDDSGSDFETGLNGAFAWSPDGTHIAFGYKTGGLTSIYVINVDGSGLRRITNSPDGDGAPDWSPDGGQIVFERFAGQFGGPELYRIDVEGTNELQLTTNPEHDEDPVWSPDGTRIAFLRRYEESGESYAAIYTMNPDGSDTLNVSGGPGGDREAAWSPDGTRIAFSGYRYGTRDIYVVNSDGTGLTRLTSAADYDRHPTWSPDGTQVAFCRMGDPISQVMKVAVDGSAEAQGLPVECRGPPDWSPYLQ